MDNPFIDEKELLALLQEMVRIESVNPSLAKDGSGEGRIAGFIGKYLEKSGLEVRFQDIGEGRRNVIGILKGTGKGRTIMLDGHTDTVGIKGMDINPLDPKYENGSVYGRGSVDMKGGLASMIGAVKAIVDSGIKLKGDVILAFVADEEYASLGTEELVKEYKADGAVVCEPSDLQLCLAHKGFAWTKVEVFGKAAHGSKPEEGVDAIVKAGKVLSAIDNLGSSVLKNKRHHLLGSPSIHASLITGGTELSTYPDYCSLELERRTIPGETRETVDQEMEKLIENIVSEDEKFNCSYDIYFYRPPLEVSGDEPIVKALKNAYVKEFSKEPVPVGMSGWLDSAIMADAGIPTAIFGPSGCGLHAAVEYVDFESVVTASRVLADTIIDFCGI